MVSDKVVLEIPPAALLWPPPSKYFLAILSTSKSPFDLKESFITPSFSTINTAKNIFSMASA